VPHFGDSRPLSRKKNIAAPIIATDINQKDPPTMSCGSNNLFITLISPSQVHLKLKCRSKQLKNINFLYIYFLEVKKI
jgi:hypothetical protein